MSRTLMAATLLMSLSACASIERIALPKPALLSDAFAVRAVEQTARVNYAAFDQFLERYWVLDENGIARLRYHAVSESDQARLIAFVDGLQNTDPDTLDRDERLAYWINLYNAQTIRVVLDNYPVDSIRDIKDGPFSIGPWARKDLVVNDTQISLNDIEHGIIRPAFNEPRIHYALNCAATSCPNLAPQAWQAEGLDAALDAAEQAYLADPRGVRVDAHGRIVASKIFIWFQEDFGENGAEVAARLASIAPDPTGAAIAARGRIDRYEYDWALNESQ